MATKVAARRSVYSSLLTAHAGRSVNIARHARFFSSSIKVLQENDSLPPVYSSFPSRVSQSVSRSKVEQVCNVISRVLEKPKYQIDIAGAYRRGVEDVNEVSILVVGIEDDRNPTSLTAIQTFEEEMEIIATQLVAKGILSPMRDSPPLKYTLSGEVTNFPIELHYVPKACHGAALLYLTGDDSYIRFLKVLAMEGMGLTFNKLGLWKPLHRETSSARRRPSGKQGVSALPEGFAIESIDEQKEEESEGDRRMRETRKEMGLPDGLDLSLDLGPSKKQKEQGMNLEQLEAELSKESDFSSDQQERITVGNGSEADILDVLGLVSIPPAMRTVKEPNS